MRKKNFVCGVQGCRHKKNYARGYCLTHYHRYYRRAYRAIEDKVKQRNGDAEALMLTLRNIKATLLRIEVALAYLPQPLPDDIKAWITAEYESRA